jgi:hypothetical protein
MKSWVVGLLMSGTALLSVSACTPVGKMTHDMDTIIQSATTKADHEALAAHYEQEAKALQDKAVEHRKMAQTYASSGWPRNRGLAEHCETIASAYQTAAKENLALAKEHRELAEAAPK